MNIKLRIEKLEKRSHTNNDGHWCRPLDYFYGDYGENIKKVWVPNNPALTLDDFYESLNKAG